MPFRDPEAARAYKKAWYERNRTKQQVFELYEGICQVCGYAIDSDLRYPDPDSYATDHVIPLFRGGLDCLTNVVPTHWRCNREKGLR